MNVFSLVKTLILTLLIGSGSAFSQTNDTLFMSYINHLSKLPGGKYVYNGEFSDLNVNLGGHISSESTAPGLPISVWLKTNVIMDPDTKISRRIYVTLYKNGVQIGTGWFSPKESGIWVTTILTITPNQWISKTDSVQIRVYTVNQPTYDLTYLEVGGGASGIAFPIADHAPVLTLPLPEASDVPLPARMEWKKPSFPVFCYSIQIARDSAFTNFGRLGSGSCSEANNANDLMNSAQYFWRVRAIDNMGEQLKWSSTRSFHTKALSLVKPLHGSTVPLDSLTLSWSGGAFASRYHIQIAQDPQFASLIIDDSSLIASSDTLSPIPPSATLYWHVRTRGKDGEKGGWSETWSFSTNPKPPIRPTLIAPLNTSENINFATKFLWNKVPGAVSYHIQFSISNDFSTIKKDTELTDTSALFPAMEYSTRYYWRTYGINTGGTGDFSEIRSFTTIPATPGIPTLVYPSDEEEAISISPMFRWSKVPGALAYSLQASRVGDFSSLKIDSISSDTSLTINGLKNGAQYFWRVNAVNPGGVSNWSIARSFTSIIALPDSIQLASPADGETIKLESVMLAWHPGSPNIKEYILEICEDSAFVAGIVYQSAQDTSKAFLKLNSGHKYFWRVRAQNIVGQGHYSQTAKFTVQLPTVTLTTKQLFLQYSAHAGEGNFRFDLARRSFVEARLFDSSGRLVKILVSGFCQAGSHAVKFGIGAQKRYVLDFSAGTLHKKVSIGFN